LEILSDVLTLSQKVENRLLKIYELKAEISTKELKEKLQQLEEILNAPQYRVSHRNSESTSAGYAVSNLRVFDRINEWLSISGGIENIFDKEYYNHLDWLKIPQKGRNIYCDLKISF
jgi:iron complex outermembrane receptor protein